MAATEESIANQLREIANRVEAGGYGSGPNFDWDGLSEDLSDLQEDIADDMAW